MMKDDLMIINEIGEYDLVERETLGSEMSEMKSK
jgi:hypothetical protein